MWNRSIWCNYAWVHCVPYLTFLRKLSKTAYASMLVELLQWWSFFLSWPTPTIFVHSPDMGRREGGREREWVQSILQREERRRGNSSTEIASYANNVPPTLWPHSTLCRPRPPPPPIPHPNHHHRWHTQPITCHWYSCTHQPLFLFCSGCLACTTRSHTPSEGQWATSEDCV